MKTTHNLLIIIISLLSLAAGFAKVMHSPQEVQFLQSFAFSYLAITLYGITQILAAMVLALGTLFANHRAKIIGAITVAIGLLLSSVLIFASGNWGFGLISLLPIVLTGFIVMLASKLRQS